MDKFKKAIKEQIKDAVEAITSDICRETDPDENMKRAQAILTLTEAYKELGR